SLVAPRLWSLSTRRWRKSEPVQGCVWTTKPSYHRLIIGVAGRGAAKRMAPRPCISIPAGEAKASFEPLSRKKEAARHGKEDYGLRQIAGARGVGQSVAPDRP